MCVCVCVCVGLVKYYICLNKRPSGNHPCELFRVSLSLSLSVFSHPPTYSRRRRFSKHDSAYTACYLVYLAPTLSTVSETTNYTDAPTVYRWAHIRADRKNSRYRRLTRCQNHSEFRITLYSIYKKKNNNNGRYGIKNVH